MRSLSFGGGGIRIIWVTIGVYAAPLQQEEPCSKGSLKYLSGIELVQCKPAVIGEEWPRYTYVL
jgi:hypothetical protein